MFGRFFAKGSRTPDEFPPRLSTAVESSIQSTVGAKAIPPLPGAAQKAFQLSIDPNAEARDFVEVIQSDEALSARVIKIANSVFFDRGKSSKTIEESVAVIGINELRCLLNATTLAEIFPSRHPMRVQFWANDIATALIARALAPRVSPGAEETLFLGGLMHDLGKLVMLQRAAEEYHKVLLGVEQEGLPFTEVEGRYFPFDHTEVGQLVGERWRFGDELLGMIRLHHAPWDQLTHLPLVRAIKAADTLAHALGLGHGKGLVRFRRRTESSLPEMWEALGVQSQSEQLEISVRAQKSFDQEYELYLGAT